MRALIADDHWISRAGLSHLLSLIDTQVDVIEAETLDDALKALRSDSFDICLVDPSLHPEASIDTIRQLHEAAPSVPIAVMTEVNSRRDALQAVDMGAQAYILKNAKVEDIRRAIDRVLAGEISLPGNLQDRPVGQGSSLPNAGASFELGNGHTLLNLTARQRDVLGLIAIGKRNSDIGETLDISPRTVQIHVSNILKLLGIGNRTEAALLARKQGIGA
jgi:DNA-binding NarL/FixJ family response regulator